MFDRTDKLVEATMLALQGKLELKENKRFDRKAKTKKSESIDVNVDETTSVSVTDNTTVVDTADATIIIEEPKETITDIPADTVEVPIEDTVMPEEIVDAPVETELPTETEPTIDEIVNDDVPVETPAEEKEECKKVESKKLQEWIRDDYDLKQFLAYEIINKRPELSDKIDVSDFEDNEIVNSVYDEISDSLDYQLDQALYKLVDGLDESKKLKENVEIEVSDDGKEVEVTTDNGEEVEVKDETPDEIETPDAEENTDLTDAGNENIEGNEIIDDELVDECKKNESIGALLGGAALAGAAAGAAGSLTSKIFGEGKVEEDTDVALEPRYDSRNSFYGKARVVTKDNGDEELYSYGTHVAGIKDGKPYTFGKFSQTTSRHQAEFFKQRNIDPKTVEKINEGKDCKNCEECDTKKFDKLEAFRNKSRELRHTKMQERLARKTEGKDEIKDVNDLGIVEGVNEKEEPVPNTEEVKVKVESKFNAKSFNEALTKYLKSQYKVVESAEITKLAQNNAGDIKLEAVVHNITKRDKNICLEMHKVQEGRQFNKYTVKDIKGLVKESKDTDTKLNMVTFTNKHNVLECRYFIKK